MKAEGLEIHLPPNPAPYVSDWLFEVGPTVSNGMGPGAIGWRDIEAWSALAGVELLPWEAKLLRRLSRDFANEMQAAKEPTCPAPYSVAVANDDAVTAQFERMFRIMAANKQRGEQPAIKRKGIG